MRLFRRKYTTYKRSVPCHALYTQAPTDHPCTIVHDPETHARLVRKHVGNPAAVVEHLEHCFVPSCRQTDHYLCGPSMFNRIVDRLLSYAIQMSRHGVVKIQYRVVTLEPALDVEEFFHFARPFLQCRHQTLRIGQNRQQTSR